MKYVSFEREFSSLKCGGDIKRYLEAENIRN